jgi:hypothetical protein
MDDNVEKDVIAGAVAALRRRAARQRERAANWTVRNERGAIVRSGEAAVALRIAEALEAAATDLEQGGA